MGLKDSQDVEDGNRSERTERRKRWLSNPLRWKTYPIPTERSASKEKNANVFSQLYFIWMNKLMAVGYTRLLDLNDIPYLPEQRRVGPTTKKFSEQFRLRVARGDKRPLLGAMNNVFFWEFWFAGLGNLIANMGMTLAPLILKYLVRYASEAYYGGSAPIGRAVGLALALAGMQIIATASINQAFFRAMTVGGMARASLISMIYAKSQVISSRAKIGDTSRSDNIEKNGKRASQTATKGEDEGWSNGKVANLMSTDTYRIDQACGWFHLLWTLPIQLIVLLIQLLINIGPSALVGFGVLAGMSPILFLAIKKMAKQRGKMNKVTDQRISLTQEILQAVRFVKYFSWEKSFLDDLMNLRKKEIHSIQYILGVRSALNAVAMSLPVFASILSFMCYALTHKQFNPAEIFSSLALFNALRMPLNMLPYVLGQTIDAYVSIGRLQEYLIAEEEEERRQIDHDLQSALQLTNASFTWEARQAPDSEAEGPGSGVAEKSENDEGKEKYALNDEPFQFNELNLSVSRTELLAVVGTVGCGKTSLLAALAGEMRMTGGSLQQGASMAYCPQYAWIQNTTVRENIIFGRPFDKAWYKEVVEACSLQPDFDMLPAGDMTEVGERGITLSGGQKQRIGIARAIYFNADIVLLDDPLSAVDAHVGRHIFQHAINGLLMGKCRVLATHQLHVLDQCDRILWLQDGKIEAIGTYEDLLADKPGFAEMLSKSAQKEKEKEKEDSTPEPKDFIDDSPIIEEEIDETLEVMKVVSRTKSARSHKSLHDSEGKLMTVEEKAENGIAWTVYANYIRASGSWLVAPFVLLMACLAQSSNVVGTVWLSYWTSGKYIFPTGVYIGVYAALGAAQLILLFSFALALTIGGTEASKALLHRAMHRVLNAPMSFFDTTPLGRIINRFSKDVDVMDNFLTEAMRQYLLTLTIVLSTFILIIVYYPWFAIALVPMSFAVYLCANYYRASARELKRHEAVLRSTVFSRFGEALAGSAAIKAYGMQEYYRNKLDDAIDNMDSAYFLTFPCQTWLSTRLDLTGCLLCLVTSLLVVTNSLNVNPSTASVVLTYVIQVVGQLQFMIKQLAEMENAMNSTERVLYYGSTELPSEAERAAAVRVKKGLQLEPEQPPTSEWPSQGEIEFKNVEMRYRDGLPLVLKGLNLHIGAGERIGIVGRTGAGKSSITSCLFRLVELDSGSIQIDGLDISKLDLNTLRTKMAIIPQDPTLFRGTVRSNLDPFGEHSDLELLNALRQASLIPVSEEQSLPLGIGNEKQIQASSTSLNQYGSNTEGSVADNAISSSERTDLETDDASATFKIEKITLDTVVQEEGLNFSLGQRQLMALARALVRDTKILICDEATSSVDEATDKKVQITLQTAFPGCTVLCIAHRLRTILKYDRVLVMDQGKVAEFDSPLALWELQKGSLFRSICDKSGIKREDFTK